MTLAELRAEVASQLGSGQEAAWVLEDVLGLAPGAGPVGGQVDPALRQRVGDHVARRRAGEPLQYVLGHWSFRRLELAVDRRALIPRPETEQLVEVALEQLAATPAPAGRPAVVVDLGTGTGAIALSVADEGPRLVPALEVWAVDDDPVALDLACENLEALRPPGAQVHLRLGSWWEGLPSDLVGRVDLVVSNPPYVAQMEWPELDPQVRDHEPHHALVAGDGPEGTPGLAAVAAVLAEATAWLARPGAVVVELAPSQAGAARSLALAAGFDTAEIHSDLSGRSRFVVATVGGTSAPAGT